MKTYKQIINQIKKNRDAIKAAEERIVSLTYDNEKTEAIIEKDILRYKKAVADAALNEGEMLVLSQKIQVFKLENKILIDNARAALFEEYLPIVADILKKYEGKPAGDRTRDKIKVEAMDKGFCFYFGGYLKHDTLHIYLLNERGLHNSGDTLSEIEIYSKKAFIDSDNKYRFAEVYPELKNPYKYTENIKQQARAILKAHSNYIKAMQAAQAAESALNTTLPRSIDHFYKAGSVSVHSIV